jgi:CubicO group peptidase (beta-lactamase class C family)
LLNRRNWARWLLTNALPDRLHLSLADHAVKELAGGGSADTKDLVMDLDTTRIDALFSQWDRPDAPGCAVGVISCGELVHQRCFGLADLATRTPICAESLFYIASVSKQFTAASVLLLAQEQRLSLDDDIRCHFPELPQYQSPITIRHLLHHTSGLRDYLELWELAGRSFEAAFTNTDGFRLLALQRGTNFAPGQRHLYCNSGYKLLAELVPRTTGLSLRDYAAERIFAPLGMSHTFFDDTNDRVEHRVQSYRQVADGTFELVPKRFTIVGSGGLVTTLQDLSRWDANFYEPRVGGEALIQALLTRGQLNDGTQLDYAGGLIHGAWKGLPLVHHAGGMLGFRTEMVRFAEERLTVICLANRTDLDPWEQVTAVADLCLAEAYPLSQYAGTYLSAELETEWIVDVAGTELVLRQPESLAGTMQSTGMDQFRLDGRRLRFCRQADTVTGLTVDTPRAQGIAFRRQ